MVSVTVFRCTDVLQISAISRDTRRASRELTFFRTRKFRNTHPLNDFEFLSTKSPLSSFISGQLAVLKFRKYVPLQLLIGWSPAAVSAMRTNCTAFITRRLAKQHSMSFIHHLRNHETLHVSSASLPNLSFNPPRNSNWVRWNIDRAVRDLEHSLQRVGIILIAQQPITARTAEMIGH